jgi:hypothetical protein
MHISNTNSNRGYQSAHWFQHQHYKTRALMSYDARFEHYDGVKAWQYYRNLFPSTTIVNKVIRILYKKGPN